MAAKRKTGLLMLLPACLAFDSISSAMSQPLASMHDDLPDYDSGDSSFDDMLGPRQERFALQITKTAEPFLNVPLEKVEALDVGCGYGGTAITLAKRCQRVVGIELSRGRVARAEQLRQREGADNVKFLAQGVDEIADENAYDLIILDNVLEHLPNQLQALQILAKALRPGGVLYLLVPNRLWPIEHHYHLPFLGYLPLRLANSYLRLSGRGHDYTDASYSPTWWGLWRLLRSVPQLKCQLTLPRDISLAAGGRKWHYRWGVKAIERMPWLWAISKAFLVIGIKDAPDASAGKTLPPSER